MPTLYTPDKRTIGSLLSTTSPPIVVPDWQRNYSWTTSEVEAFWSDLLRFDAAYPGNNIDDQEYFLGSVVIVETAAAHKLLDGQQRLATSAILLSVIRDSLRPYMNDAATRTQSRYLSDFDDALNDTVYKITLNEYDRDFYKRAILETRTESYQAPAPQIESHKLILAARTFLEDRFREKYEDLATPKESHDWALRIQKVLTNHMSVVAIFSRDEDNAANVFETLNDRGIGLSTPDLVRNLLLRRAVPGNREEIVDLWGEILGVESDARLKAFLRHYWMSHYGDVKTQSLYREIKATILQNDISSIDLSRELRDTSILYRDIVSSRHHDPAIGRLLENVQQLGAALMLPPLLSAIATIENPNSLATVIEAFIIVYVRHSVIGGLENSRMENIFFRISREIRTGKTAAAIVAELTEFAPSDDVFRTAFETAEVRRRATARYVLKCLEADKRTTEELEVAPPSSVHVEHIYPQTPQAGQRLAAHGRLINRLGNLSLLSCRLNSQIRNAPFARKKPRYEESELLITKELSEYDEWGEDQIKARQERMSLRAPEIWSFPE